MTATSGVQTDEAYPNTGMLDDETLSKMFADHEEWRSNRSRGKRLHLCNVEYHGGIFENKTLHSAIFYGCDFSNSDFSGANLYETRFYTDAHGVGCNLASTSFDNSSIRMSSFIGANLRKASFRKINGSTSRRHSAKLESCADFAGSDFSGAVLRGAYFAWSSFSNSVLRDTDLSDADIAACTGITAEQFGGANLARALLPEAISGFEPLAVAKEAAERAGRVLVLLYLLCGYGLMTMFTTSDAQILTNAPSIRLPNIGTALSTVDLFTWLPPFIIAVFLYFQFYMNDIWTRFSRLPAIFPDGVPLDRKAHPWPVNVFIRRYFVFLFEDEYNRYNKFQAFYSSVIVWYIVPLTLFLIWLRYLRLHDPVITAQHIAYFGLTLLVSIALRQRGIITLSARAMPTWMNWRRHVKFVIVGSAIALMLLFTKLTECGCVAIFNLNLTDASISTRIETLPFIRKARLENRNLRGARAQGAVLQEASMRGADLFGADLQGAFLENADLRKADLRKTKLFGARVQGTHFIRADLRGANLDSVLCMTKDQFLSAITDSTTIAPKLLPTRCPDFSEWMSIPVP